MCIGFILKMTIRSRGGRILLDRESLLAGVLDLVVCVGVYVVGVGEDARGHGMMLHLQDG